MRQWAQAPWACEYYGCSGAPPLSSEQVAGFTLE
jgi:hypothetical protein